MDDKKFDELVSTAIDKLPKKFIEALDNVAIVIEGRPTVHQKAKAGIRGRGSLFGLYEGVPLPERGGRLSTMPDKITIFKDILEAASVNDRHLVGMIENTVWHEIAHYFGLGHDAIHRLEKKAVVKKQFSEKIEIITADNLNKFPITQAWFTREGGVSSAPFDSLNANFRIGDRPEYAHENIRRAMAHLNRDSERSVLVTSLGQSNKVFVAKSHDAGVNVTGVDVLVTDVVDLPLALTTADCLPIFLYDKANKAIALVHAGWRGTSEQVVQHALSAMQQEYGTEAKDVSAALGPAATVDTYEVKEDVASLFDSKYIQKRDTKMYLDIVRVNIDQLNKLGVIDVYDSEINTMADYRFFSHRRDKITGRFLSLISL